MARLWKIGPRRTLGAIDSWAVDLHRLRAGTDDTLFHFGLPFEPGRLPLDQVDQLRLVRDDTGEEIPVYVEATAPHFDGASARAVLLQGRATLTEGTPLACTLQRLSPGNSPATRPERESVDLSAVATATSETGDNLTALKESGYPDGVVWYRSVADACAARPFGFALRPLSEYADHWAQLAGYFATYHQSKFDHWSGSPYLHYQYDRGYEHLIQFIQTGEVEYLRKGLVYTGRYATFFDPEGGIGSWPSFEYQNTDCLFARALLLDDPAARRRLAAAAGNGRNWLDNALGGSPWIRASGSDGDFRPLQRHFCAVRRAAELDLATTGAGWIATYNTGMSRLESAEQWVEDEVNDTCRYTHNSVNRFDDLAQTGPTSNFMLFMLSTELTYAHESGVPVDAARWTAWWPRCERILRFGLEQATATNTGDPATARYSWNYYSDEEGPYNLNLNGYYCRLNAYYGWLTGKPEWQDVAELLVEGQAGDGSNFDAHRGPYLVGTSDPEHKTFNQTFYTLPQTFPYRAGVVR